MKQQKAAGNSAGRLPSSRPVPDRRAFSRAGLPAAAFALDPDGNEIGRVAETSGGGLRLEPASPWAMLALRKGQQLTVTIVEPGSGNRVNIKSQVMRIGTHSIGLRFL